MSNLRNAGDRPVWARRAGRVASALGMAAVMAAAALTSCTDAPTAVPSAPLLKVTGKATGKVTGEGHSRATNSGSTIASATKGKAGKVAHGLRWTSPAKKTTASNVIGPDGGILTIADGIRVIVPAGAVSSNVTFSVTRLPGKAVAYDFQPHGTIFAVPVQIEHPTDGTTLVTLLNLQPSTTVRGAYFAEDSLFDPLLGTAFASEFRTASISPDWQWIRFSVDHFSGYMVSMD